MKQLLKLSPVLYLLFLLLLAGVSAVFLYNGFTFVVTGPLVWLLLHLAVEGGFIALCARGRKLASKPVRIIAQLLPLGAFLYFLMTRLLLDGTSVLLIIFHGVFCFVACFVLALLYAKPRVVRIVSAVVNSVLLLFLLHFSIGMAMFSLITLKYDNSLVIRQLASPDTSYTAVLSSLNQGVQGRYSLVDVVHEYRTIDLGFGRFQKTVRIYTGSDNEYTTMLMEWEDDQTLLINGEAYAVE